MDVSFATEPAPGRANEDHVVASDRFAVVLDGVSCPPGVATGCVHDVRWLVRTLGATLAQRLAGPPREPLAELLAGGIRWLRDRHGPGCDLTHPESPSSTVAILRERDDQLDYLVLCDSSVVIDGGDGIRAVTDDRTARLPAYDRASVARVRNTPAGYWVASTDPGAAAQALTGSLPRDRVRRVVLCTDGVARLVERFGLGWPEVFAIIDRAGPRGAIAAVRAAERQAPARRGKRFDDATLAVCHPAPPPALP